MKRPLTHEAIWEVVRCIPRGLVATYGEVAREAGMPGRARLVGYALHRLPPESDVPGHRVVNAKGMISLRAESDEREQRRLLHREGVRFRSGSIDLKVYGWMNAKPMHGRR